MIIYSLWTSNFESQVLNFYPESEFKITGLVNFSRKKEHSQGIKQIKAKTILST